MHDGRPRGIPVPFQPEQILVEIGRLDTGFPEFLVTGLAQEALRRMSARANARANSHTDPWRNAPAHPSVEDLETLCHALVSGEDYEAVDMVFDIRANGVSFEDIYLCHLAPAARMLGDWWLEDRATFVEVTIGTGRLFSLLRELKPAFAPLPARQEVSVVFASVPGEDHTLGVRMAADLFREDGWDVALKIGLSHDDLVAEIEAAPRSIVGLSIGGRHSLDALSRLVLALHLHCPNAMLVVAGHDIDEIRPHLALLGLDGIARDLVEARAQISALWDREIQRRARLRGCAPKVGKGVDC